MTFTDIRTYTFRFLRRAWPNRTLLTSTNRVGVLDVCNHAIMLATGSGVSVASRVTLAKTFKDRFNGLLRHQTLPVEEALLLSPGGSIHTVGMRFPIDAVFLDRHMRVLKCVAHLKPWRVAWAPRGTVYVLELASGRSVATRIHLGMRLLWSDVVPDRAQAEEAQ